MGGWERSKYLILRAIFCPSVPMDTLPAMCVGCQKVWCILLQGIVCVFLLPTHLCPIDMCRASESLMYFAARHHMCILTPYTRLPIDMCRASESLTYSAARQRMCILTLYTPMPIDMCRASESLDVFCCKAAYVYSHTLPTCDRKRVSANFQAAL